MNTPPIELTRTIGTRLPLIPDRPWLDQANCQGEDPDLFFVSRGLSWANVWDNVRHLCEPCPVRTTCREYGLTQDHGMWGGIAMQDGTPQSFTPTAGCGTLSGYERHRYKGELPCGPCRQAKRRDTAARRQAS